MLGVGFTAARKTISAPSLIPPKIPPAWLVFLIISPSSFKPNSSLLTEPVLSAAANPSPISKPFTAPIDIIAFAKFASNLSNTVFPTPAGIFFITHSITPPAESCSSIFSCKNNSARAAASASGIYTLFFKICSRSNLALSISTGPIDFA